ncbi:MAG: HEAT repeat domain-containing protein [Kiritimatiellae bacterium]|nr:HEAT repeat domain-containing protein [Kiritimatiellia bacterium]
MKRTCLTLALAAVAIGAIAFLVRRPPVCRPEPPRPDTGGAAPSRPDQAALTPATPDAAAPRPASEPGVPLPVPPPVPPPADARAGQPAPSATGPRSDAPAPASSGAQEPASETAGLIARASDTAIPLDQRRHEIMALGQKGDGQSARALMALGDAPVYLNVAAVQALADIRTPDVTRYLTEKLRDPDPRIVCEAIRGLGKTQGDSAVPAIAETIRGNRTRPDGFDEMVCEAAAQVLGLIAARSAVPVLAEELARCDTKGWSLEYGSEVVRALGAIGGPDAKQALLAYAAALAGQTPEDPLAKPYVEGKIAEARHHAARW